MHKLMPSRNWKTNDNSNVNCCLLTLKILVFLFFLNINMAFSIDINNKLKVIKSTGHLIFKKKSGLEGKVISQVVGSPRTLLTANHVVSGLSPSALTFIHYEKGEQCHYKITEIINPTDFDVPAYDIALLIMDNDHHTYIPITPSIDDGIRSMPQVETMLTGLPKGKSLTTYGSFDLSLSTDAFSHARFVDTITLPPQGHNSGSSGGGLFYENAKKEIYIAGIICKKTKVKTPPTYSLEPCLRLEHLALNKELNTFLRKKIDEFRK